MNSSFIRKAASGRFGKKVNPNLAKTKQPQGRMFRSGPYEFSGNFREAPQGLYSAFVPVRLPPKLDWTARLIGALSDADRLIGRLAAKVDDF
jgi:hypothetical protein